MQPLPYASPVPFRGGPHPGAWQPPPPIPGPFSPEDDYLLEDDRDISQDLIRELEGKAGRLLQVKRLDMIWDPAMHTYDVHDTAFSSRGQPVDSHEDNQEFAFVCRRKFEDEWKRKERETLPHPDGPIIDIEIKSPFLKYAAQQVMGTVPGISWTAKPLIVSISCNPLPDFTVFNFIVLDRCSHSCVLH